MRSAAGPGKEDDGMKRFKWAILVVVIIGICAGVVFVPWGGDDEAGDIEVKAGTAHVWLSPASWEAATGDQIGVEIVVDSGSGISGAEIELAFDGSALSAIAVVAKTLAPELVGLDPVDEQGNTVHYDRPGSLLGEEPLVGLKQIDNDAGTVKLALARKGETTSDSPPGILAGVTFEVLDSASAGDYDLQLTSVRLTDQDFEDIPDINVEEAVVTVE